MKTKLIGILCLALSLANSTQLIGNDTKTKGLTLCGYITNASNGEALTGATIYLPVQTSGTYSNEHGYYTLSLPAGSYLITYSFIGFASKTIRVDITQNAMLNIALSPENKLLEETKVWGYQERMELIKPEMGSVVLSMKSIKQIPAMLGEVDLIKTIQLLPGIQATSEGASSFSVRGGAGDQNLILLDEATLYNASHLMGFFSVFNNDAISSVKIYKGDIPSTAGGRLASLLEINTKNGNTQNFSASGGIGLLASRLTTEGPLKKGKSSFIVSGRRSYIDLFTPLSKNQDLRDSKLYFYDLNAKLFLTLNGKNHISLSGYAGHDRFKNNYSGLAFGNQLASFRWNHEFNPKLYSKLSLSFSQYDYELNFSSSEVKIYTWRYHMNDVGFKYGLSLKPSKNLEILTGIQSTWLILHPGTISTSDNSSKPYTLTRKKSSESAIYIQFNQKINEKLSVKYGGRLSFFNNIGADSVYIFKNNSEVTAIQTYPDGRFFNWQTGIEPRLGISYTVTPNSSVKASFARTRQNYQMATNSTSGTPLDLWFSASKNVKPQISDQWSLGYNICLIGRHIELSAESFYKNMQNTIDFRDHPILFLNRKLEGELRFGKSYSYGTELFAKFEFQKINGWLSYSYSRSKRKIQGIANDHWFTSPFERPHAVNIVFNFEQNEKNRFGLNWVYLSGQPATFPVGRMDLGGLVLPVYSGRNTERFPNYHRLDVSFTRILKSKTNFYHEISFSIYNISLLNE